MHLEDVARRIVHESLMIHRDFGPGMLESAYETLLFMRLQKCGLYVECQKPIHLRYRNVDVPQAFRVDLLVESQIVIELKAVERLPPVGYRQVLTYLKILDLRLGFLINFGAPTLKQGIHRIAHDYFPDREVYADGHASPD